jgi:hypothetical protein
VNSPLLHSQAVTDTQNEAAMVALGETQDKVLARCIQLSALEALLQHLVTRNRHLAACLPDLARPLLQLHGTGVGSVGPLVPNGLAGRLGGGGSEGEATCRWDSNSVSNTWVVRIAISVIIDITSSKVGE